MITAKEKISRMKRLLSQTRNNPIVQIKSTTQTKLRTLLKSTLHTLDNNPTPKKTANQAKPNMAGKIYRRPTLPKEKEEDISNSSSDSIDKIITNKALRRAYGIKKKVKISKSIITHVYIKQPENNRSELLDLAVSQLRYELMRVKSMHHKDILIEQQIKLILLKSPQFVQETHSIDLGDDIERLQTNRDNLQKQLHNIMLKEEERSKTARIAPILKKTETSIEPAMFTEKDIKAFEQQWENLEAPKVQEPVLEKRNNIEEENYMEDESLNKENYSEAANTHRTQFEATWKELEETQKIVITKPYPQEIREIKTTREPSLSFLAPYRQTGGPIMITPRNAALKSALKKEKTPQSSHHRVKFDNEVIKSEFTNKMSKYYRYAAEDESEKVAIQVDVPTPKFK